MGLGPVVENGTVPASAAAALRSGRVMRVPLLMGGARDELRLYVAYAKLFAPFLSDYGEAAIRRDWLPTYYGADAPDPARPGRTRYDAIVETYGISAGLDGARLGSMLSDRQSAVGIANCLYLEAADAFLGWSPVVHTFEFADPDALVLGVGIAKGMDPGFALGAVHSSALNYLFPNLSNTAAIDAPDLPPTSQALADEMVAYLASFATTGSPRPAGLPAWPRHVKGGNQVLLLAPGQVAPYDASARHRCAFWRGLFPADG
jgi:para-nitrobenzyl esterase